MASRPSTPSRTASWAASSRTFSTRRGSVPKATPTITNYSVPETRMGCGVTVGVAFGTDPLRVEKVLLEAAHEAVRDGVEGLLAMPEPGVRFNPGFGDSSLNFTLGVNIRQFTDQFLVQSELRKRIVKKFTE